MTDDITTSWIRNESDERAARAGYRFDVERAAYTAWWIERYCRLYEGDWAGEPLILRGAWDFDWHLPIWEPFYRPDGRTLAEGGKLSLERAAAYSECFAAGDPVDWQYEVTMRAFGWVKHSPRWKREVRRFRKAGIFVAKKNKKSPTLAAWGHYLLSGDGEAGQKVFLAAKDGAQARGIAGKHAVEMVFASSELSACCRINRSEMSITHESSRSVMRPLSSGNESIQKAKEGLNGSVLIDETHVVDHEYAHRINRAGISRSEPMHAEFSTSGSDNCSYGKEQFDYGHDVLAGRIEDHEYMFASYEAPQNLDDADLAANPVEYGKMANPAWGHTIGEEEYLSDYRRSSRSVMDLAEFKMYRLNIWQRSASPWIRESDWNKNRRDYTPESLLGEPCAAGLDLSQTDDMTALALVFPEDPYRWTASVQAADKDAECTDVPVKTLLWYWLPEGSVKKHQHETPFAQWVADGWIRQTPGDVMDYGIVEAEIGVLLGQYDVQMFGYDKRFAMQMVQGFTKRYGLKEDRQYSFTQSWAAYTGPVRFMERLLISGKFYHNGHPVTDWQAGHVQIGVRTDNSVKPIKPGKSDDDPRKIDGIVADVIAVDAAIRMPPLRPRRSFYEDHALEFA